MLKEREKLAFPPLPRIISRPGLAGSSNCKYYSLNNGTKSSTEKRASYQKNCGKRSIKLKVLRFSRGNLKIAHQPLIEGLMAIEEENRSLSL